MALSDAQAYEGDGSTRDFSILGEIPSESHLRVWIDDVLQSSDSWDLLGSTVLFDDAPADGTSIQFIVSTTGTDFPTSPSDISEVAASIINVNIVAENIDNVNSVATNLTTTDTISTVANSINDVNITANDIANINILANYIATNTIGGAGGGGQFLGTSTVKAVQYMATSTNENLVVLNGTNAFSIGEVTLENGASITVENNATYKVL